MSWALVAGASEGIGEAFAHALAARGHDLILLARRESVLETTAAAVRQKYARQVVTASVDLGAEGFLDRVKPLLEGRPPEVVVWNAAASPIGSFLKQTAAQTVPAVMVNCRGPVELCHLVLPGMVERKRGAVVLMSSLTAYQGTAYTAVYGATKAFNLSLAEALWAELRGTGVEVMACCAGPTRTPGYTKSMPDGAPGELDAAQVAEEALRALGSGPAMTPGLFNTFVSFFLRRMLPRRAAISIMASQTKRLIPP